MGIDLKHFKSFNHNISNWSMKERIYIFVSFLALTLSFMVLFIYFIKVIFRHHKLYFGFTFLGKLFYLSMLLRKVKQYSLREKCPHSKLFWSVFSVLGPNTERYLRENTDQKNSKYGHFSHSDCIF